MADANAYARQLKQLLPRGAVWLLEGDSWISKTLAGIALEIARIDARALDVVEESDPRTAVETLPEYERVLGLPDGCVVEIPDTTLERQYSVTGKVVARGGQTPAFFVAICAARGVAATCVEFWGLVLRTGFRVGDRCYGLACVHTFRLDMPDSVTLGLLLAEPTVDDVTMQDATGGVLLDDTTYYYRVSALNAAGHTAASVEVSGRTDAGGGDTNQLVINWQPIAGATGYKIYGRAAGAELLIGTVGAVASFIDDGSVTPAGALPASNTARTAKALALECAVKRAKPAHSIALFSYL